jgi:uncharacterized protein YjbI with pentapeptide repeats
MSEGKYLTAEQLLSYIQQNEGARVNVDLSECVIAGENLSDLDLHGINLMSADLRGALLLRTNLQQADLRLARLDCGAGEEATNLERADLRRAWLQGASLRGVNLRDANLSDANLTDAVLIDADLRGADLSNTIFEGADLRNANLQGATLLYTKLDRDYLGKRIVQEKQRQYQEAKSVYLRLKKNFEEIGDGGAASWAYVKEREMERNTYHLPYATQKFYNREVPANRHKVRRLYLVLRFYLKYSFKWVRSYLMWAFWGYGERPSHALIFSIVILAIFTIIFASHGGITKVDPSSPKRLVPATFSDYFLYTLGAFTTTSFADLSFPAGDDAAKILTALVGIAGITALAMFTSALGQRLGGR